jgi:multidrug efflux pump subunit AcrB
VYGIVIGLTGGADRADDRRPEFTYRDLEDIADEMRAALLLIDDVAKVDIFGAQQERIFVEYNNTRLAERGRSPSQLRQILEARNIIIPGGEIRTEFEEVALEPSGNFETLDELKRTVIQLPGRDDLIFLGDVARIDRSYIDPPKTKMRSSGSRSLGLAVSMRDGGNILALGEKVREVLTRVLQFYPIGVEFDVIQFQPDDVKRKIDEFTGNLFQAVAIVTLVMLLSLGLRTGLVVASLIPMAMLSALTIMGLVGIGLDQISIAALIIALGMLVDNAIVMSESIMVQMAAGTQAIRAAVASAAELRIPLLTSSLTTAAAFLPIFMAESSTGEYTAPLFKVVTIILLCSWFLSLTMIPMLCAMFLRIRPDPASRRFDTWVYRTYRAGLLAGLRNRLLSLIAVAAVLVVALLGFRFVPVIFFPPNDRPTFTAEIELPTGTPLARTETVTRQVERFIEADLQVGRDRPAGVTNWAAFIGNGGPRFMLPYSPEQTRPEYAMLLINATSRAVIDELIPPLEAFCQQSYPEVKATVRPLDVGPPAWPPIEVRVSGRDTEALFAIVDRVKARLRDIPGTRLIDDNWGARSKKLMVRVDQPRARRAGVTSQDVAISLQALLSGLDATEFREDDELIPVTLRSVAAERRDLDQLESLNVYAQATGESVPLKQVADVEVAFQPSVIHRYNRLPTITVEAATVAGVTATDVIDQLVPWLEAEDDGWGLGYGWELGGETETSQKAQASIKAKLPIAGLIIVLLLVGQFNSIRRPLIILLTIPLSLIGVTFGLLVTRSYFGFMTLLGIISLAGVVINNAIVLIDRIKIEIEEAGCPPARAVIESAQRRLRPIVLTTCTTVGGLLPLWLGGGAMFQPMAIAMLFGLIFATGLTLGVVPILYSVFFRVGFDDFSYPDTAAGDD